MFPAVEQLAYTPNAVYRRRDTLWTMQLKSEFLPNISRHNPNVPFSAVKKIPSATRSAMDHVEFVEYDVETPGLSLGSPVSWVEFQRRIKLDFRRHCNTQKELCIENNADIPYIVRRAAYDEELANLLDDEVEALFHTSEERRKEVHEEVARAKLQVKFPIVRKKATEWYESMKSKISEWNKRWKLNANLAWFLASSFIGALMFLVVYSFQGWLGLRASEHMQASGDYRTGQRGKQPTFSIPNREFAYQQDVDNAALDLMKHKLPQNLFRIHLGQNLCTQLLYADEFWWHRGTSF